MVLKFCKVEFSTSLGAMLHDRKVVGHESYASGIPYNEECYSNFTQDMSNDLPVVDMAPIRDKAELCKTSVGTFTAVRKV